MAHIYTIRCPKCGKEYEAMKGILMSECDNPVPDERREETPVACPHCGQKLSLKDEKSKAYIQTVMMVD